MKTQSSLARLVAVLLLALILLVTGGCSSNNEPTPRPSYNAKTSKSSALKREQQNKNAKTKDTSKTNPVVTPTLSTVTLPSTVISANNNGTSSTTTVKKDSIGLYANAPRYVSEYPKQVQEILSMMLQISIADLESKNIVSSMISQSYKDAFDINKTSSKVLMQMDNIIRDRNRSLAEMLILDFRAYEIDTNLVDIVRIKTIKKK